MNACFEFQSVEISKCSYGVCFYFVFATLVFVWVTCNVGCHFGSSVDASVALRFMIVRSQVPGVARGQWLELDYPAPHLPLVCRQRSRERSVAERLVANGDAHGAPRGEKDEKSERNKQASLAWNRN